ncbi:MAG: NUDIX domain-containing protein [Candidatus Pacearchaeota archaeon]
MSTTYSAGGVILNNNKIVLIMQPNSTWSFPKGKIEAKESRLQAAVREIKEETGLTQIHLIKELGTYTRPKMDNEGNNTRHVKQITLFLFTTTETSLNPEKNQANAARWFTPQEVEKVLSHPIDREFFRANYHKIFK